VNHPQVPLDAMRHNNVHVQTASNFFADGSEVSDYSLDGKTAKAAKFWI